jgi:two-component system, cell cycle response regulator DivK
MKQALVVDDIDTNRTLMARLLTKQGWTVAQAEGGQQAIDWLEKNAVHLILMDICMPAMSGEEACRVIRDRGLGGNNVKMAAYTAHAMPEEKERFLSSGFDSLLIKPVTRDRLNETLAALGFSVESK